MSGHLTLGGIHKLFNRDAANSLIFQVLTIKYSISSDGDVFLLKLSDGTHYSSSCIVGTQLNLKAQKITPNSRIQVNRYICNFSSINRKVVVILDMDLLDYGRQNLNTIGNPTRYEPSLPQRASGNTTSGYDSQVSMETSTGEFHQNGTSGAIQSSSQSQRRSSGASERIHSIMSLAPYKTTWTIRARVTNKSDILPNKDGGFRFFFDLLDETGEIRATAFYQNCEKFYNEIEVNNVYFITSLKLQIAEKKYIPLNNDYEIIFNYDTEVRLCETETNISRRRFTFVGIDQIETFEAGKFIDVIGICIKIDEVSIVYERQTGTELKKRDIRIVDRSGKEVQLTLWKSHAENFDVFSLNSVIAVKGAKVTYLRGILSVSSSSILVVKPDIEESQELKTWYEMVGHNLQTENFSMERNTEGIDNNLKMIGEALSLAKNLGFRERAYYFVKATIIHLLRDCLYKACPAERCEKKVIDMNNGVYRCAKCKKEYDSFIWRYMLKIDIADRTDSVRVILFRDQAESLLGYPSDTLETIRERDENEFHTILNSILFKEYIFELAFKMESYMGEKVLQTIVESVRPINYENQNKVLLTQLKMYGNLERSI